MIRRAGTSYGDRANVRAVHVAGAVNVSKPTAGFFRFKMRSGGVYGGVRIWFGPPHDPVTGEELDRSWRWQAEFNGQPCDFDRVWPACCATPITEIDYNRYCARTNWARHHAPESAFADHGKRLDPLSTNTPLPF